MNKALCVFVLVALAVVPPCCESAASLTTYDYKTIPKLRVIPPWRYLTMTTSQGYADYGDTFCSYIVFNVGNAWSFPIGATQFTGYINIDGATQINSVSSLFNNVKGVTFAGQPYAIFYASVQTDQTEYINNQVMKFQVCGSKLPYGRDFSSFGYTGYMVISMDFRPPPPPIPGVAYTWPISNVNASDCFSDVLGDLLKWDYVLSGDFVGNYSKVNGKIAAGGNVHVGTMWSRIGSDYSYCPTVCPAKNIDNTYIVAGGYVKFYVPGSGGMCGGYMQGSPTAASGSYPTVDPSCPQELGVSPINFTAIFANVTAISQSLATKTPNAAAGYALNRTYGGIVGISLNPDFDDYIIWIPGDFISQQGVFKFAVMYNQYLATCKSVILNFAGSTVILNVNMTDNFKAIASKVIMNFYQATVVQFSSGEYWGTVLAPYATVYVAGGSITHGQIIAKSLKTLTTTSAGNTVKYVGFTTYAGTCVSCGPGSWGPQCKPCTCKYNQVCNDGLTGDGKCTCLPNFDSACVDCVTGHYGLYCNNSCTSTCTSRGTCDDGTNGTGVCLSCNSPWNGTECQTCISTKWGPTCTNNCQSICFTKLGTCDFGVNGTGNCATCGAPWANGNKSLCEDCDYGHYGSTCQYSCTTTCAKHGNCSHGLTGNGTCLSCREIYQGDECQLCAPGYYGPDCLGNCTKTCLLYGTCNDGINGDGTCSGCKSGTTGSQCEQCLEAGAYGSDCKGRCKDTCTAHGKCDTGPLGTGRCLSCNKGYSGKNCQISAALGTSVQFWSITTLLVILISTLFQM